jgi:hypothetical protein
MLLTLPFKTHREGCLHPAVLMLGRFAADAKHSHMQSCGMM